MKNVLKIVVLLILSFGAIQLIPVDRSLKPINKTVNFVNVENTPPKVVELLRNACYDCHSNETKYPDYAFIAPISWMINDHVEEGREYINFSEWGTYNQFQKNGMLEGTIFSIKEIKMPLPAYIQKHPKANLSTAERTLLINYFLELLKAQPKK